MARTKPTSALVVVAVTSGPGPTAGAALVSGAVLVPVAPAAAGEIEF
eukprot:SAG22_NODE_1133_length_5415_cov_2.124153_2_plen_47_part_00